MQKQVITMIFFISTFPLVFIALSQCHFSVNFPSNQILAGDNPASKSSQMCLVVEEEEVNVDWVTDSIEF